MINLGIRRCFSRRWDACTRDPSLGKGKARAFITEVLPPCERNPFSWLLAPIKRPAYLPTPWFLWGVERASGEYASGTADDNTRAHHKYKMALIFGQMPSTYRFISYHLISYHHAFQAFTGGVPSRWAVHRCGSRFLSISARGGGLVHPNAAYKCHSSRDCPPVVRPFCYITR